MEQEFLVWGLTDLGETSFGKKDSLIGKSEPAKLRCVCFQMKTHFIYCSLLFHSLFSFIPKNRELHLLSSSPLYFSDLLPMETAGPHLPHKEESLSLLTINVCLWRDYFFVQSHSVQPQWETLASQPSYFPGFIFHLPVKSGRCLQKISSCLIC